MVPPANVSQSVGAMGCLAAANGRLYYSSGGMVPAAFALATGEPTTIADYSAAGTRRCGKDLALLDDNWLVFGGRRLYANINRWMKSGRTIGYTLCRSNLDIADGPRVCLGGDFAAESILPPLFDDEIVIANFEYPGSGQTAVLQAWNSAGLAARAAEIDTPQSANLGAKAPYFFGTLLAAGESLPSGGLWSNVTLPVFTAAASSSCG